MIDYGRLADIIREASIAMANKNTGPISFGGINTSDYNMGSWANSALIHNEVFGDSIDFLWAVHTWDDRIHKVR